MDISSYRVHVEDRLRNRFESRYLERVMQNLDAHPDTMKQRHRELDETIQVASGDLLSDDLEVARQKREKLALKDRIKGIR